MACSACSAIQQRTTCPGWYCPQGAGPSHSITDQEKVQETCLETSLWKHFLGGASPFPGDPGLHQVDEKAASTYPKYLLHDLVFLGWEFKENLFEDVKTSEESQVSI